ncbi:SMI1/KNR4 family protein [Dactylosporangium sp. CS-033363]|uniref:SMI1/KNR4 family protein n=1 Tax=Dactylosporangium sp. CS-033363 TaxID=3239935 RepID=UPI003D8F9D5E
MRDNDRLLSLATPPERVEPFRLWAEVEGRLGTRLPLDYKWLVDSYGAGSFDDFLYVLVPESPFPAIRLEGEVVRAQASLESLRRSSSSEVPYGEGELLPVAKTDNGDAVFWVMRPVADPELWSIAVLEGRGVRWSDYAGGVVAFLADLLSGRHRISWFPDELPSSDVAFQPVPETPDVRRLR